MNKKIKEIIYPDTNVRIENDKIIEIENCKKIIEYNDIHMCVRTYTLEIHVWGENLSADDYGGNEITVKGRVKSVEFEPLRK
jgi:hypothetical protein